MKTISLAVIVKDNAQYLRKMLQSCVPAKFDEIVVVDTGSTSDEPINIAKEFGAKTVRWTDPDFFTEHGHIGDFAAARNFSFEQCSGDWIMWLDSDDELPQEQSGNIHRLVNDADRSGFNVIFVKYNYARDARGNVWTEQIRERIVKNRQGFRWVCPVHEVMMDHGGTRFKATEVNPAILTVEHKGQVIQGGSHDERNLRILERSLAKHGELDPRSWKNLGMARRGLRKWEDSIAAYREHIRRSNWDDDVYLSQVDIAACALELGRTDESRQIALEAVSNKPKYPQAYIALGEIEIRTHRYDEAIHWLGLAERATDTTYKIAFNPSGCKLGLYTLLFDCFLAKRNLTKALQCLEAMEDVVPDRALWETRVRDIRAEIEAEQGYSAYIKMRNDLFATGEVDKISKLDQAAPSYLQSRPLLAYMKKAPVQTEKPTIAFLCPQSEPPFNPKSILQGIGGSEEAVIYLTEEFAKLGYQVDVFAGGGYEDKVGPVHWYPFAAYRASDFYDVVVTWRYIQILDKFRPNCRLSVAWLHDLPHRPFWTDNVLVNLDYVIFLSRYHRSQYPWVHESKAVYSRNGIIAPAHVEPKHDPKLILFTSNPTRGLKELLDIWPDIHAKTGAELHSFYGITRVTQIAAAHSPELQRYIRELKELQRNVKGYFDHGMVGHKELSEWHAKAGVWAYFTQFPEISCISAMRAQALGTIPVTANFGALDETVQHGIKLGVGPDTPCLFEPQWREKYKAEMISLLNDPSRQAAIRPAMMEYGRSLSWEGVARQWDELFNKKRGKCSTEKQTAQPEEMVLAN